MNHKHTIAEQASVSGVGIHSGQFINLRFIPNETGEIIFRRTDLGGLDFRIDPPKMAANNSSNLIQGSQQVLTIEHLMAALSACGVDSILIELDGPEVPILDGSALPFVDVLDKVGTRKLDIPRKCLIIRKKIEILEGDASLCVSPADSFIIDYRIAFDHPVIGVQKIRFSFDRTGFASQIAPARTFGFLKDVPELRARQLALGGSFENALVLDDKKVINGPLRFSDEFVRHKVLDLIGDLSILGYPVVGEFTADMAGHRLHHKTIRFLLENPDVWSFG
jgi:UDP-3-O-[3-hydroxymyristoyl] N-acetylglucosamine deacetylase